MKQLLLSVFILVTTHAVLPLPSAGASLEEWIWRSPLPNGHTLWNVVYGNGRFVAVGNSGELRVSLDGVNWSVVKRPSTEKFGNLAFGKGRFVLSTYRTLYHSTDGTAWTLIQIGAEKEIHDIIFDGDRFVAIGGYARMSGFTFVRYISTVLVSADGLRWTDMNPSTTLSHFFTSVVHGNNIYVASTYINSVVYVSSDLMEWERFDLGDSVGGLAFGNGRFLARTGGKILESADGRVWILVDAPADLEAGALVSMNDTFFILGEGVIMASTDGKTWVKSDLGDNLQMWALALGGGALVAVGEGGVALSLRADLTWQNTTPAVTLEDFSAAAYGNGVFLAVTEENSVFRSSDGIQWTRTAGFAATPRIAFLEFAGGSFFLLQSPTLYVSQNGADWTPIAMGSYHPPSDGMAAGDGILVAVGVSGRVMLSAGGADWEEVQLDRSYWLRSAAWGNGLFVAVGSQGLILSSPDGRDWSPATSGLTKMLNKVIWADGAFLAVGDDGTILRSTDGRNWDSVFSASSSFDFTDVVFGSGRFVAVSALSKGSVTSADGIQWVEGPPPGQAAASGEGSFVVVGANGSILQAGPACSGILFPNGTVHVPFIDLGGVYARADFVFESSSGGLLFRLADIGLIHDTGPYAGCPAATLSGAGVLHVPHILFDGASLWADLAYVQGALFTLSGAGVN